MRLRLRRKDIARKLALASGEDEQDFQVMLETVRSVLGQTEAQLAKLQSQKSAGILPASGTLREAWESANIFWRRDVIKLIVDRIEVMPSDRRQVRWNGMLFNPDLVRVVWLH